MHPTQRAPREGAERRAEAPIRTFLSLSLRLSCRLAGSLSCQRERDLQLLNSADAPCGAQLITQLRSWMS